MSDTLFLKKIIDGQSAMHASLLRELNKGLDKLGKKVDGLVKKVDNFEKKVDKVEINLTKRIDRLGEQLAYLKYHAPNKEEFMQLEQRVIKVEEVLVVG